jgi:N-acetylglucosaminyl-diphospho-decaprenol L-rhamnosyltransferase
MNGIGAVIVTHNSEDSIGPCLEALRGRVERVVVVDNASTDGSAAESRKRSDVTVLLNTENLGFAAAVNQGAEAVQLPFILLLNPDVVVLTDLEPLVTECSKPGVGAAAGKLIGPDGLPQAGFSIRRFPTPAALAVEAVGLNRVWKNNPVNRRYRCLNLDLEQPGWVEQPAGAFVLLRRTAFQAVEGFDADYWPVWYEDVDFFKRLASSGYRVRYTPAAVARHQGGHSVRQLPGRMRVFSWYGSLLRYSLKHHGPIGQVAVDAAVAVGCAGRMVCGALGRWRQEPLSAYGRVSLYAWRRLLFSRIGEAGDSSILARQEYKRQSPF